MSEQVPYRCPVCSGSGMYLGGGVITSDMPITRLTHPCHSCGGLGTVWSYTSPPALLSVPMVRSEDFQDSADSIRKKLEGA